MYIAITILFLISAFIIIWAMIGFPLSLIIIDKLSKKPKMIKDYEYNPSVTLLIVAHNEEKVIHAKLKNVLGLNYPKDRFEILVSSDNSTDQTNKIVRSFIENNQDWNIRLYEVKKRMGKTNAQNEAAATVETEILIMTDANAMLESNSITEIVAAFSSNDIAYVTGRLQYVKNDTEWTSTSESTYWEWDLRLREIESKLHSVTAGNGALYACRTKDYYNFDPLQCHDSAMPKHYVLLGKRAIYNKDAVAYEKAGANVKDEYGRKVRMSRTILKSLIPDLRIYNVFKYKWYSYCYFGHRYCRRNLWLAHIILFFTNILLAFKYSIFLPIIILQIVFYLLAILKPLTNINNKVMNMAYYYVLTITAQVTGAVKQIFGKSKPFWDKAQTTR